MFSRRGKKPPPFDVKHQGGRALSALVRVDQEFLAGRTLGIDRDVGGIEHLLQRHHLGVVAREGGLWGTHPPPAPPVSIRPPHLHQQGEQERPPHAPPHAPTPVQYDRRRVAPPLTVYPLFLPP